MIVSGLKNAGGRRQEDLQNTTSFFVDLDLDFRNWFWVQFLGFLILIGLCIVIWGKMSEVENWRKWVKIEEDWRRSTKEGGRRRQGGRTDLGFSIFSFYILRKKKYRIPGTRFSKIRDPYPTRIPGFKTGYPTRIIRILETG